MVGVAGATPERGPIFTAGLAALVGGAVSMALGEYVSVSSQRDSEKAQLVIEHSLTNTGNKDIDTNVYCHNFLTLSPGDEHITITAPFAIKAEKPFAPDAAAVEGKTIKYLRAVKEGESVTSPISGFGNSASDYDFTVKNTATGFGQRIRGDQPLARINFWSIATNVSWEPYVAISLKPGQTKHWTYTYDYIGPK